MSCANTSWPSCMRVSGKHPKPLNLDLDAEIETRPKTSHSAGKSITYDVSFRQRWDATDFEYQLGVGARASLTRLGPNHPQIPCPLSLPLSRFPEDPIRVTQLLPFQPETLTCDCDRT